MRVYTVTYLNKNYGSVLQAYALQRQLRAFGAEPVIVQPASERRKPTIKRRLVTVLRPKKHYTVLQTAKLEWQKRDFAEKERKLDAFINDRIQVLWYKDLRDVSAAVRTGDLLLAGSDQIWSSVNGSLSAFYTFRWPGLQRRVRRFSYAASTGGAGFSSAQMEEYARRLQNFEVVSFREKQAAEELKGLFDTEVRCDPDPTLLIDSDAWKELASPRLIEQPYLFVYMLRPDANLIRRASEEGKKRGCRVIYTGLQSDRFKGVETVCDAGVEDFLSYILYADAVITNSFHGTVFSVLFERPFVSVKIASTSARVDNLLDQLELSQRGISPNEGLAVLSAPIDFAAAHRRLAELRGPGLEYLRRLCENGGTKEPTGEVRGFFDSRRRRDCRGCTACSSACPVSAIRMEARGGFVYPAVDEEKCIHCGRCAAVCRRSLTLKAQGEPEIRCGWNTDPAARWNSTSGGAFPAIVRAWRKLHPGSWIYGAVSEADGSVRHIGTRADSEIARMYRSKYVQSDLDGIFPEILQKLRDGDAVLFSGTPCQVAGLRAFLGRPYPDLLTVDFICHGVSDPRLLRAHVAALGRGGHGAVESFSFRNKKKTPGGGTWRLVKIRYADGYEKLTDTDPFIVSYKNRLFYRDSCYECVFSDVKRVSDLTLGDLWGIEDRDPSLKGERLAGISMVECNTPLGTGLLSSLEEEMRLAPIPAGYRLAPQFAPTVEYARNPALPMTATNEQLEARLQAVVTKKQRFFYSHRKIAAVVNKLIGSFG